MIDCTCRHQDFNHDIYGCTVLVCCETEKKPFHNPIQCDCVAQLTR